MIVYLIAGSFLMEMASYGWRPTWYHRKFLAGLSMVLLALLTLFAAINWLGLISIALIVINFYRAVNLLRIFKGRMHEQYLKSTVRRTGLSLFVATSLIGLVYMLPRVTVLLPAAAVVQMLIAVLLLGSTLRTVIKTKSTDATEYYADRDLPSVTVAIPARNETADMEDCLKSVLSSNYPKLEILVLDDSSQDKTSEIIKQFAQAGVRFIPGDEPGPQWLAKNLAYDKLYRHATGKYILFCGVDVRFDNQTIRAIVAHALAKPKRMISVLPKRIHGDPATVLLQPLRYWWEIALPRRLFNRPPVLSSCWLIERRAIGECGGFQAVSRSIFPEAYFARELIKQDGYSLMRSHQLLGVYTAKSFRDQFSTAIRTRYPQLRRRPERVLLTGLLEGLLILWPLLLAVSSLWSGIDILRVAAVITVALLLAAHLIMVTVTQPADWWAALVSFPFLVVTDIIVCHISMLKYEFSVINWKGRDVSMPVMHAIPRLPEL